MRVAGWNCEAEVVDVCEMKRFLGHHRVLKWFGKIDSDGLCNGVSKVAEMAAKTLVPHKLQVMNIASS